MRFAPASARPWERPYTIDKVFGYPAVINNPEIAAVVAEAGRETAGAEAVIEIGPSMGGRSFSYFMQKAPGMFLMLGGGNPATDAIYPHHHPKFDIDDSVLPIGVKAFARATFKATGALIRQKQGLQKPNQFLQPLFTLL